MKILLSSHMDTVIAPFTVEYKDGMHMGLLDNWIGVLATYLALQNESIALLAGVGKILVWHNRHEEFGILIGEPKLDKKDVVIVIDVACGDQYKKKSFSLENISGFSKKQIKDIQESLEWEGYEFLCKEFDNTPDDEDEAWQWRKKGHKVISFIIPIHAPGDNWHGDEAFISSINLKRAVQGLQRLICYLS